MKTSDKRKVYTLLGVAVGFGGQRRSRFPASYVVTFPGGRTTSLECDERRQWTVRRLDEGPGSTAVYDTLREAKESLRDAGATVQRRPR